MMEGLTNREVYLVKKLKIRTKVEWWSSCDAPPYSRMMSREATVKELRRKLWRKEHMQLVVFLKKMREECSRRAKRGGGARLFFTMLRRMSYYYIPPWVDPAMGFKSRYHMNRFLQKWGEWSAHMTMGDDAIRQRQLEEANNIVAVLWAIKGMGEKRIKKLLFLEAI